MDNGRVKEIHYVCGNGYKLKKLEDIEFLVVYLKKPQGAKAKPVKQTGLTFSDIVKSFLKGLLDIRSEIPKQQITIHWKCLLEMNRLGVTTEDLRDVFYHGSYRNSAKGTPEAIKRYSGYEIGITYRMDKYTGDYLITWCWKTVLSTV